MITLILLFCTSFLLALALTPLCRNRAVRLGLVDRPDHVRKTHSNPIPRIGGIPIFIAFVLALCLAVFTPSGGGRLIANNLTLTWTLVVPALFVFVTGLADDLLNISAWQKLMGQAAAAGAAYVAGVQIINIGGHLISGWIGIPLTIAWLILCSNAFNLIDGMDGLATGVGLFATITTLLAALLSGNMVLAFATMPLIGALAGFLRYNFNPATIFLGDSGSLTIGFVLGCYGILWSEKSVTVLGMTAPLMALSIPLLDTVLAIVRRILRGQPIFSADRGHIHHKLLDRGLTPRQAALFLYAVCGIGATCSLLLSVSHNRFHGAIIVVFCAAAWFGIQHLGYIELRIAGRLIVPSMFLKVLQAQLRLYAIENRLVNAKDAQECFYVLKGACEEFGFTGITVRIAGSILTHGLDRADSNNRWTIRIPISDCEYANFETNFESSILPMVIEPFSKIVCRVLREKSLLCQQQNEDPCLHPVHEPVAAYRY